MVGEYRLIPIAEWGNVAAGLVVHKATGCGVVREVYTIGGKPYFSVEWYESAKDAHSRRKSGNKEGLISGGYTIDGEHGIYVIKQEKGQ